MADLTFGRQREKVVVPMSVDGYYWRCESCGWLGTGHTSVDAAQREGVRHVGESHVSDDPTITLHRVDWRPAADSFDATYADETVVSPGEGGRG